MSPRLEHGRRVGLTLLLALAAAFAFERLRSPLPWMIGPLIVTAAGGMAGLRLAASGAFSGAPSRRRRPRSGLAMKGLPKATRSAAPEATASSAIARV